MNTLNFGEVFQLDPTLLAYCYHLHYYYHHHYHHHHHYFGEYQREIPNFIQRCHGLLFSFSGYETSYA